MSSEAAVALVVVGFLAAVNTYALTLSIVLAVTDSDATTVGSALTWVAVIVLGGGPIFFAIAIYGAFFLMRPWWIFQKSGPIAMIVEGWHERPFHAAAISVVWLGYWVLALYLLT